MPTPPAFDPADVPESNATLLPEPYRSDNRRRWNRRLGAQAGLSNFGVTLTRIEPGGQSSPRHAHSAQDEFVWVVEGEVVLETDAGPQTLVAGHCAGFAGTGDGHRFVNRSDRDALILVVGDTTAGDRVDYPDHDLALRFGADGTPRFTRKDGTPL